MIEGNSQVLKKIAITDLMVDMYIAEIIETPNVPMPKKRKGMIRDSRIISKFVEIGIQQVVIDTAKGLDVIDLLSANDDAGKQNKELFDDIIEEKLANLKQQISTEYQSLTLEWSNAKEIFKTSSSIVSQTISAIRNGDEIHPGYFDEASKAISRSIMRNKDALTWLGKIRNKDNYLYEHSVNSATLMGIFAHAYGLESNEIEQCITGALLHDVGQAHIASEYFERAGPLSPEEFAQVKNHVNIAVRLLEHNNDISDISLKIVQEHHERVDGSGYPKGLKNSDISLYGRMFAIVDTYDAVTNKRCYKEAIPSSYGMRTLLELSKTNFDESLVHQFIKCMGVYPTGSLVRLDNGYLAVVIAQNPLSPLKPLVNIIYNAKSNAYVKPTMVDLGKAGSTTKIVSYEDPKDFGIKINDFMPEEMS